MELREALETAYAALLKARIAASHAREGLIEIQCMDALKDIDDAIEMLTGLAR